MPRPALSRRRLLTALPLAAAVPWLGVGVAAAAPGSRPPVVPFGEWAPGWVPRPTGADAARTVRLVVHHTAHPVARTPEEVVPALTEVARLHTGRGFDTIGYHYVVDPWGGIWQGRGSLGDDHGLAPAVQAEGAHVAGSNPGAVGVAFLGDHRASPPTTAALDAATRLLAWLAAGAGLDPHGEVSFHASGGGTAFGPGTVTAPVIAGHRASNRTVCPGRGLAQLLPELRTAVASVTADPAADPWGLRPDGAVAADGSVVSAGGDADLHVATSGPVLPAGAPLLPGPRPADLLPVGLAALVLGRWVSGHRDRPPAA